MHSLMEIHWKCVPGDGALVVIELLHDFADLGNEETILSVQCGSEYLIADIDLGLADGSHSFTLDRYKDEFGSPREISFSR